MPEITKRFTPKNRDEWRAWLERNHATAKEIWLVRYKMNFTKPTISYDEAVEEALCFGWIDGIIKSIDAEKYAARFSPRRSGSIWSETNKARVAKVIAQGLMMPIGLAKIEEAKANGEWDKASQRENTASIPADLKRALQAHKTAQRNFQAAPPSQKRMFINWVTSAKRDETRRKRIAQAVEMLQANQKIGIETRMTEGGKSQKSKAKNKK